MGGWISSVFSRQGAIHGKFPLRHKKAIFESERDYSDERGYYSKDCYIDYIYFLVKNGEKTNAIEYLQEAIHKFGVDSVLKEIKDDSYEYNRSPYRATILDYLSEVKE